MNNSINNVHYNNNKFYIIVCIKTTKTLLNWYYINNFCFLIQKKVTNFLNQNICGPEKDLRFPMFVKVGNG